MRNIETRLAALEKQRGSGQTIIVWRHEDDAIYEKRLVEAEAKCGPFDTIMVVGWQGRGGHLWGAKPDRLLRLGHKSVRIKAHLLS
jgi:hypothetical protein